jgi:hypothetical protein
MRYRITNKQTNEVVEEEFDDNEDVYLFAMQMFFVDQHQPIIMELIHE